MYPKDSIFPTTPKIAEQDLDKTLSDLIDRYTRTQEPVAANANTGAIKHDQDKPPLHLLSTEALNQVALVMQFGAQKYAAHNWRKGFQWSRPTAAAMRHILAWNNGEDLDPESQLSHLAHAMCCLMFLLEFQKTHPHLDDRYKPDV